MLAFVPSDEVVWAVAFAAGGYAAVQAYTSRHLNGLGRKLGRVAALLVLWADTEEKKKQVAELLSGK
jgi:hypothetical protein